MIVLPSPCGNSPMTSTGIQADVFDQEGALGHMNDVYKQFIHLQETANKLQGALMSRGQMLQRTEATQNSLESMVNTLETSVEHIESIVRENEAKLNEIEKEYDELDQQKEQMEEETHELRGQEVKVTFHDVDNEHRLTEYVRDEVFNRMENLSLIQNRMSKMADDYSTEWEQYKADAEKFREKTTSLEQDLCHFQEIALARYIGLQNHKDVDESEKNLTKRIIEHHNLDIERQQLQQQLAVAEIQSKDLENEISGLINEKRLLWKRCLDLEKALDTSSQEKLTLRPAAAHADLHHFAHLDAFPTVAASDEMITPSGVEFVSTGKILHRCHKQTHLALDESLDDQNIGQTKTQIDSGALDLPSEKIDGGKSKQQDTLPPPEPEGDKDDNTKETINKTNNLQLIKGFLQHMGHMEHSHTSVITKLRKRTNIGMNTSTKRKTGTRLSATGSFRKLFHRQ